MSSSHHLVKLPPNELSYIKTFIVRFMSFTTKMKSDFKNKIYITMINYWSWWWEVDNDRDALARTILTISVPILAILWYKWTGSFTNRGRNRVPPGPYGLPVVGYLPFLSHNLHERFTEMAHRYGPIFSLRLGSKFHVVVNSMDLAKVVARELDQTFANRNPPITALTITYGALDVVWSNNNAHWRNMRKLLGRKREMQKQREHLDRIFESVIEERIKTNSRKMEGAVEEDGRKDFLQIMLELKDQKDASTSFDIVQIKALLFDILTATTDTASTMVEWVMAEILRNPDVKTKIQEELMKVVGMDNIVEESHLPKLKYLDAVVKETFRIHPPLPLLIQRCPDESCMVDGYQIPKGSIVYINVWAIQHDPKNWTNPLEFKPERFLNGKWDYSGTNMKFLPFGSGRRICPGVPLGEKMLMYILASLLHSFEWILPKDEEFELSDEFGFVTKKRKPLVAIPFQRLSNSTLYE
ncbi:putative cytochrome P450 [Helianthus annuus]|uniref:Cytochrome P450 n=1 Tax=Helianthus annuus TaxID=4232 RepID=A0A9K3EJV5_HELAN|nr:putative cytochrome P450 [Helianthus annuus]KAJ0850737.1 putative cytochrome P450 [Helianthus annuus]